MTASLGVPATSLLVGQVPKTRHLELLLTRVIVSAMVSTVALPNMLLEIAAFRSHGDSLVVGVVLRAATSIHLAATHTVVRVRHIRACSVCRCNTLSLVLGVDARALAGDAALRDLVARGRGDIRELHELVTDLVLHHWTAIRAVTDIVVRCVVLRGRVVMLELLHLHDRRLVGQVEAASSTSSHVVVLIGRHLAQHTAVGTSS